jgi:ABC-type glycerol-3-phosphate transport system permease component
MTALAGPSASRSRRAAGPGGPGPHRPGAGVPASRHVANQQQLRRLARLLRTVAGALVALAFLVPLLWMLSSSLKSNGDVFRTPPSLVPRRLEFGNYRQTLHYVPFGTYFTNSAIVTAAAIAGTLLSCVPVAYALSIMKWRGRGVAFAVVLGSIMLPFPAVMIPWYIIFKHLGWIGTLLPVSIPPFVGEFVTPAFSSALAIFLLRQFFLGIPREIIEAARIDGAGHVRILLRIVQPLARPVIATVVITTTLASWTAFIGPLLFLSNTNVFTLSVGLQQYQSQHFTAFNYLMAASVIFIVPVLVVFFLGQKYFVRGASRTGLK